MSTAAHIVFTAEDKTKSAFASVKRSVEGVQSILSGFKHELLALAGIAGFGAMIESAIEAGAEVEKLSKKLGASTESLSQYKHVAEVSHVAFESLTKGWQLMEKNVSLAAQHLGPARQALDELNISAKQLNVLKPEDQFERLADAMSSIKNPADRVRMAMQIFGRSGAELIPILQGGSSAIENLRLEANQLGLTLDETSTKHLAQVHEAFVRLKSAFKGLANTLVVTMGPALSACAEFLSEKIPKAVQMTIKIFIRLKEIVTLACIAMVNAFQHLFSVLSHLPAALGRVFKEAAQGAASLKERLLSSVQQSEKAFSQLTKQEEIYHQAIQGTSSTLQQQSIPAFGALSQLQKQLTEKISPLVDKQKALSDAFADGKQMMEAMRTPHEVYEDQLKRINQLLKAGAISHQTYKRAIKHYQLSLQENTGLKNFLATQKAQTENQIHAIADIFRNGLFSFLDHGFKGLVQSFKQALSAMAVDAATSELSSLLFGKNNLQSTAGNNLLTTGINWLFKGFSSFAGFRAEGGSVLPHHSYVVGERGPELFMPKQAGNIVPNSSLNTSASPTVVMHIHTPDATSFRQSQGQICTQVGLALQRALVSHT